MQKPVNYVRLSEYSRSASPARSLSERRIREVGFDTAGLEHVKTNQDFLLFRKSEVWAVENEHRYVVVAPDRESEFSVLIRDCLHGLVFGVDFPSTYFGGLSYLRKVCNDRLWRLQWGLQTIELERLTEFDIPAWISQDDII